MKKHVIAQDVQDVVSKDTTISKTRYDQEEENFYFFLPTAPVMVMLDMDDLWRLEVGSAHPDELTINRHAVVVEDYADGITDIVPTIRDLIDEFVEKSKTRLDMETKQLELK